MDSEESQSATEPVEMIFEAQVVESSIDVPMEQWSSLEIMIPEANKKKILYEEGLYDIGSGEICGKYITVSASSVLRHHYFAYPAIKDPGIEKALFQPEDPVVYEDDGQALYLATCKEMNQYPVRSFHKALLGSVIDLRYYCVNPYGVRAMAIALKNNTTVKMLILIDSFLNNDACYHIGNMLQTNTTLTELNLRGCRIGPSGAKILFAGLRRNRVLIALNLSHNQLGDNGMQYLASAIFLGLNVKKINLSYNNISGKGANMLTESLETHNCFTHINLSWNNLLTPGTVGFLSKLGESFALEDLNLAWNSLSGPRISLALKNLVLCPMLRKFNLSNNKLDGEAVQNIITFLNKAKKLVTLNLSYNPLNDRDALNVLNRVKSTAVKVQNVLMENVFVKGDFLSLLQTVKQMKSKKNLNVVYGGVMSRYIAKGPDARKLILNRIEYLCLRPKKHKVDFALIALQLQKDNSRLMAIKEFGNAVRASGAPLDDDLIDEIGNTFSGPRSSKFKTVDMNLLIEYVKRKWPGCKLPPTPPPEAEPLPVPVAPKGKETAKNMK